MAEITFAQAQERYLNRATLKSPHTIEAYARAIDLFLQFIAERPKRGGLPVQQHPFPSAGEIPLSRLGADDAPIFLHYAQWLLHQGYKIATVRLRLAGVMRWFQYMDDYNWLPAAFPLAKARRILSDELNARTADRDAGPKEPPPHMDEAIYYYDSVILPERLQRPDADPERVRRWEVTRLRNRALMHTLAETGGRISEVLSLNVDDFPTRNLKPAQPEVLRIRVQGKGGHSYHLRLFDALPAIRDYIAARGLDLRAERGGKVPLFVNHTPAHAGRRMSRYSAWHVVQAAARALGLPSISPHDFRHWRATQLVNAGVPLDVVQDYLGHQSVETTRTFYARTDPKRVDDAARSTRLPRGEA
ncbi:MAG: tyrosine-type recombinase/integrase [Anaerolineae bacterium]